MLIIARVIASGGDDGLINFFNTSLEFISSIDDPDIQGTDVTSLGFNINSNFLGYSSSSGFLKIWDLKSSVVQLNYKMTNNNVTSICFNSDSSILTAGTFKGEIMNFNIPTMSKSNAKIQLNSKINLIRYSPFYSTYVASSLMDGTIKIIDTTTGNIVTNFAGYHQGAATGICFSPINKLFLSSVGVDNRVNFYDVLAKKHIKTINTTSPLTSIAFNTDGQTIAVGNINGGISIYDLRNSSSPKFIISDHNTEINHLEFSLKNKIRDLNSSGLNSSRVDLNSSRMNKSFNSGEINAPSSMVNQSVAENNKLIAENKINIDNNKLKISDTSKANESEFKTVKENLKKQIEINQKFIDKKKILDGPQGNNILR